MNPNEWFQPSPNQTNKPATPVQPAVPQQGYPTQPQPNAYISADSGVSGLELAEESVEHSAKPVLWLGLFLVVVLLATLTVVATDSSTTTHKLPRLAITAVDVLLAAGVVFCGRRIQTAAPDHARALKAMTLSIILCGGIFGLSVVEFFVTKRSVPPLQGVFALAAGIFLATKHVQLKRLA